MVTHDEEFDRSEFGESFKRGKINKKQHIVASSTALHCSLHRMYLPIELRRIIIDEYYRQPHTNETIRSAVKLLLETEDDPSKENTEKYREMILRYGSISSWNTSHVTNMRSLCEMSSFNEYIQEWDVSNVTNMRNMFYAAHQFNQPLND